MPDGRRRWLELGSYEGRSALWALENAIRLGDELVCVDTFLCPQRERVFDEATGGRATKVVSTTVDFLGRAIADRQKFHVVYVDADHSPVAVLQDAVMSYICTYPGGAIIFDDYPWMWPDGRPGPKAGIDAFLELYSHGLKVLHKDWQVIVQKVSH